MRTRPGDFTPQAEAYARARPGYPAAMVTLLVKLVELGQEDAIAEIGAGTGIFTRVLSDHGLQVTAVEPNAGMRGEAPEMSGVRWQNGTFESTGLDDASQSWLVAAQAFHWATPEKALPELRRALRSSGALTVLWNNRDNDASPLLSWTRDVIDELVPDFDEGYRDRDWSEVLTSTGDFVNPYDVQVPHTVDMTRERYLDLWRSHNLLNAAAGPERMATLLAKIERHLADTESVVVPYVCRAWTAHPA